MAVREPQLALRPGTAGFTIVLSMAMAATALAIDTVLPTLPAIREALDLGSNSNAASGLITAYFLGSSLGLLPAGLLSDRFGRRPVMWVGFALYVVGAVGAAFAPTLPVMLAARFVWGLGSAGPRIAALAMVRDVYVGEQMARQMSYIMAVFILVPTFAPSIASGLLTVGPWQTVFIMCAVLGVAGAASVTRLPETLAVDDRRSLAAGELWRGCRTVLSTPGTLGYLLSLTMMFGVFMSYLASSESILDEVFGHSGWWFPLWFGGLGIVMGIGMLINGKLVQRNSLDRMIGLLFSVYGAGAFILLIVAVATSGRPPFTVFTAIMAMVLFAHGVMIPNLNSAAMRPLAQVAGTGAAILGMVSGAVGSLIGAVIDQNLHGTITPLAIGFAISAVVALASWRWALRATARAAA
jgi:MFS transporter, DHA1 family, multidrug resistance protein